MPTIWTFVDYLLAKAVGLMMDVLLVGLVPPVGCLAYAVIPLTCFFKGDFPAAGFD